MYQKSKQGGGSFLDCREGSFFGWHYHQPTDRRRYSIFLTKEGKKLQEKLLPTVLAMQEKAINALTKNDLETLQNLLNQIYGNLS